MERLRTSKVWPKLKAKAAATRHLALFAFELISELGDPTHPYWGDHDRLAQGVCQLLCRFYELVQKMIATEELYNKVLRGGKQFGYVDEARPSGRGKKRSRGSESEATWK